MDLNIKNNIIILINNSSSAILSSIDENNYPEMKSMFIAKHDGLKTFWFSTNVSSKRYQDWNNNFKAGLYIVDTTLIHGLMLLGKMTIHNDIETKKAFWNDGDERYYPQGVNDPDYCIMSFNTESGTYWENGKHIIDKNMLQEF